jgi:hypothetical protein
VSQWVIFKAKMSPNGYHMAGEKTEEGTATLCWQQDTLVELQDLD